MANSAPTRARLPDLPLGTLPRGTVLPRTGNLRPVLGPVLRLVPGG